MTIRFSFDTNFLIYAVDGRAGSKKLIAEQLLDRARLKRTAFVTEQSVIEFLHIATRKAEVPLRDAAAFVYELLEIFELLLAPRDIILRTLENLSNHRLSVWDARMLALCSSHSCTVLFSEDMQDGGVYDGVRVVNPFHGANQATVDEILNS